MRLGVLELGGTSLRPLTTAIWIICKWNRLHPRLHLTPLAPVFDTRLPGHGSGRRWQRTSEQRGQAGREGTLLFSSWSGSERRVKERWSQKAGWHFAGARVEEIRGCLEPLNGWGSVWVLAGCSTALASMYKSSQRSKITISSRAMRSEINIHEIPHVMNGLGQGYAIPVLEGQRPARSGIFPTKPGDYLWGWTCWV